MMMIMMSKLCVKPYLHFSSLLISLTFMILIPQDDFLIGGANVKDNENHWKGKDGPCGLF